MHRWEASRQRQLQKLKSNDINTCWHMELLLLIVRCYLFSFPIVCILLATLHFIFNQSIRLTYTPDSWSDEEAVIQTGSPNKNHVAAKATLKSTALRTISRPADLQKEANPKVDQFKTPQTLAIMSTLL